MKKFILLLLILPVKNGIAQTYLSENFNYGTTAGILSGSSGVTTNWKPFLNAGIDTVLYSTANLTYTGYTGGGAVTGSGSLSFTNGLATMESVNTAVTAISSGSVYISFLMKVTGGSGSNTNSEYFLFFNDTFGTSLTTNYVGRLFLQNVFLTPAVKLGLSKSSGSSGAVFASTNCNLGTTYLVVMRYMFNAGSSTNDSVYAWFFSSGVPAAEPAPQLVATDMTVSDISRVRSVCIRQGPTTTNSVLIDGMRAGTSWGNTVLPVKWLDISAKLENENSVSLNWSTASEINNDRFDVEKSIDHSSWIIAGSVKGKGNSNSTSNYLFTDNLTTNYKQQTTNTIFYRLKQVDLDGNFQYSEVVSAALKRLMNNEAAIFPNPFTNSLTVNSSTSETVSIYNMEG
ncbi:MAG: hypothetical protein ACHQK8_06090, partial [Bacteroidia bacterium]